MIHLAHKSSCTCPPPTSAARLRVNRVFRTDPTRTLSLRKAFVREVDKRFNRLAAAIRVSIVDNDCFGLKPSLYPIVLETDKVKTLATPLTPAGSRVFAFTRADRKVNAFMNWLNEQEEQGVLEIIYRPGALRGTQEAWTDTFVHSSYQKGIQRARQEMIAAGDFEAFRQPDLALQRLQPNTPQMRAVLNQPMHADRLGAVFTRTFSELKGIDRAMDQQISRVLTEGLMEGRGPKQIAKTLMNRVSKIGKTRARMMARTEIVRAHHVANINEYRQWGVKGVEVQAEWATGGFGVCPQCAEFQGRVFTLDEIEALIPKHPNCKCVAIPVKPGEEPEEERVTRSEAREAELDIKKDKAIAKVNKLEPGEGPDPNIEYLESPLRKPALPESGRRAMVDAVSEGLDDATIQRISPKDITHIGQETIEKNNLLQMVESWPDVATLKKGRPIVVKLKNQLILFDGHHRMAAAQLMGEGKIAVRVVNADALLGEAPWTIGDVFGSVPLCGGGVRVLAATCITQTQIGRARRAKATHKPATRKVQRQAAQNETRLAKRIRKGKVILGNEPFDVVAGSLDEPMHMVEVKTIVRGTNDKITMHRGSRLRKLTEAKQYPDAEVHTVIFDDRPGRKAIYYYKGVGSFRLNPTNRITLAELRELLQ